MIASVSMLVEVFERKGKIGLMAFKVTETRWTNQRGELGKVEPVTGIYY